MRTRQTKPVSTGVRRRRAYAHGQQRGRAGFGRLARPGGGLHAAELAIDGGASLNDWLAQFQSDILGVPVPRVLVPLNPGKNITVISEVVAMSHLQKFAGLRTAERFNERLIDRMRSRAETDAYLEEDYE